MSDKEFRTVRAVRGGPVLVQGPVSVELADGTTIESDRFMVAICACGRSKDYPLCDTSHRRRCRTSGAKKVKATESPADNN
ncbi:CDGSH iron-sulfur domain-containing protein [Arthrobacter sp. SLBN-53]|uniref:CDGSH iron-sulfur domain-containing protein n=1 Tax=Arthrobacter sp. SLBN-53 TaxID=2768412 RepID=UPI00114E5EBC|nr:CDGSH iron-sulfur domain-containing protein [Arthrobacter sp. SLBN-53]TQK30167.1 iron-binding CDGSH zinc finger protein [Arthrobacter sp. SLBN-53]